MHIRGDGDERCPGSGRIVSRLKGACPRWTVRRHTVLVNFWTLTCINWLRQEPYVRAWSQAHRDDGLVVIGVHTPEYSFEHDV